MTETTINRAYFSGLLQSVAERGRALVGIKRAEPLGVQTLLSLSVKLLRGRGEASGAATARAILDGYGALGPAERRAWLEGAATRFGPDLAALAAAARAFLEAPDDAKAADLSDRAEPTRQELIRRLNHAPGGTLALVRMREDILDAIAEDAPLQAFDRDFRHLFASWFNRGFLVLRRIDWTTPANILEKIIRYEAVHAISGWEDLRRRLEPPDRRLYAFFHPALDDEPLIFVEVALTTAIPDAIQPLLASERAAARARRRDDGRLLFDLERATRTPGRQFRQFPDQAGRRGSAPGMAATAELRHAVARARLHCLAGGRTRRPDLAAAFERGAASARSDRSSPLDPEGGRGRSGRPSDSAARRALLSPRALGLGPRARSGRALSPRERRAAGAPQSARRPLRGRPRAVAGADGELSL